MKVLVVDDNPMWLEVAKVHLAEEHVDVICANGGEEGLEAARRERPDLILLDIGMADISGFDTCRALKDNPETCTIPVIFLTVSTGLQYKVKGMDLGAVDYITKPFDAFEFRARVRAALRTKRMHDLLMKHAQLDPLTELANRAALTERLQKEWARIQRHSGSIALIMIDVDNFKEINDTYGHSVGDRMLQEVAGALVRQCRESDCVARCGGDEFAILCPGIDAHAAAQMGEQWRLGIQEICVPSEMEGTQMTASFGIADSFQAKTEEELLRKADEALYRAKEAGRNQVVINSTRGMVRATAESLP